MPSESPYTRLAGPVATRDPRASIRLTFGERETPYALAHRAVGEWRQWRELLEASGIEDPFDLAGLVSEGMQGHMDHADPSQKVGEIFDGTQTYPRLEFRTSGFPPSLSRDSSGP